MSMQRLQKILAQAGVASRRAAEQLITEGRVRVNGRIVRELGSRANPSRDRVEVDGKRLVSERPVYYLMHKPRGVVTTLDDPEGRKSVKDLLRGVNARVFPVGRLDFHTSGALLLTNDGALAHALLHPTRAVPKVYNAKLEGEVDAKRLELLRAGVTLEDGHKTRPAEVDVLRSEGKSTSLVITISEGKNRQIHRMGEAIGRSVLRLTRIAFAGIAIDGLRAGQLRPLTPLELAELKQTYMQPGKRKTRRGWGEDDGREIAPFLSGAMDDQAVGGNAAPARRPARASAARSADARRGPARDDTRREPARGGVRRGPARDDVRVGARRGPSLDKKQSSATRGDARTGSRARGPRRMTRTR
jgi:23S rRNA pseudouridine2605 synthase